MDRERERERARLVFLFNLCVSTSLLEEAARTVLAKSGLSPSANEAEARARVARAARRRGVPHPHICHTSWRSPKSSCRGLAPVHLPHLVKITEIAGMDGTRWSAQSALPPGHSRRESGDKAAKQNEKQTLGCSQVSPSRPERAPQN